MILVAQRALLTISVRGVPRHLAEVQRLSVLRPPRCLGRRNGLDETLDAGGVAVLGRLAAPADDDRRAVAQQVHVT